MKKLIISSFLLVSLLIITSGCSWSVGGGQRSLTMQPTIGQQMIDLQKAKDSGAITDSEYQAEKTKLLAR